MRGLRGRLLVGPIGRNVDLRVPAPSSRMVAMRPFRCLLSLHDWELVSSDDGSGRFRRCRRCGKHDYPPEGRAGNWAAGTFGGG